MHFTVCHMRTCYVAVLVELLENGRNEVNAPERHANSTDQKLLQIPAENSRIQLGAPVEVEEGTAHSTMIRRTWQVQSFEIEQQAEDNHEHVH